MRRSPAKSIIQLSLSAVVVVCAIAIASPANAANGGGCTSASTPAGTVQSCISASFLNANPDGYVANPSRCRSVVLQVVNDSNTIKSTAFPSCGKHVLGDSVYGCCQTLRTYMTIYFTDGTNRLIKSPWLHM